MDSAEKFLLERGYTQYPVSNGAEKFFQKTFCTEDGYKTLKRFIGVYQWDQSRIFPNITSKTYEVRESFEVNNLEKIWWEGTFYSINAEQLRRLLPTLEDAIKNIFQTLGGRYQD